MQPEKKKEDRGLPKPRPEGQPDQQDATTGDEGGAGFYGPKSDDRGEGGVGGPDATRRGAGKTR
jgi:hypothetical protein